MVSVMLIKHDRHVMRIADSVDKDGDLHVFTSSSGVYLTPSEQVALHAKLDTLLYGAGSQPVSAEVVIGRTPALAG